MGAFLSSGSGSTAGAPQGEGLPPWLKPPDQFKNSGPFGGNPMFGSINSNPSLHGMNLSAPGPVGQIQDLIAALRGGWRPTPPGTTPPALGGGAPGAPGAPGLQPPGSGTPPTFGSPAPSSPPWAGAAGGTPPAEAPGNVQPGYAPPPQLGNPGFPSTNVTGMPAMPNLPQINQMPGFGAIQGLFGSPPAPGGGPGSPSGGL